jgi:predicted nucleotidyltransferase
MNNLTTELEPLTDRLARLRAEGRLRVALLFGSFAKGGVHRRSDIDLAISLPPLEPAAELEVIDEILMAAQRDVSILRLDDPDESPLVVQEALKGIHLVDPDWAAYYRAADWALHESESIRSRRGGVHG